MGKKEEEGQEEDHGSGHWLVSLAASYWMLLDVSSSEVRARANVYQLEQEVKLKGNPIGRFI